ncbi:alpha/beta hydrolase [Hyphomicrobium sp.]|uniref:alpha/beta fold hydrolase n=1 Tax=Hyphomicrobium sp. TaxID=82 RepID=UPI0025C2AD44|nr:alpha/beta hydrolase [Hyphomicrobium sp.]MCC7253548.1 alpha/beta hydrolase [Hyphomicrobium sp.]
MGGIEALSRFEVFRQTTAGRLAMLEHQGQRSTVLLIHGNSSCKEVFAHVVPMLIEVGYGVLAPDLPGHGDSENASDPHNTYSFPGYAAALGELLDDAGVEAPIIVGWSLGGHVAMELAAHRPTVRGLMVIGSPPCKPAPEALEAAFRTHPTTLLAGKAEFSTDDVKAYAAAMLGVGEPDAFLRMRVRRTDGLARKLMFSSALAGVGVDQRLVAAEPSRPFAVVHGADDPFVRLDYLRSLHYGRLWRSEVVVLEQVGHAPHWQAPDFFTPILLAFLNGLDAQ